ncbi:MAG TPA: cytochrome c [Burkholderiaceae bacterium]
MSGRRAIRSLPAALAAGGVALACAWASAADLEAGRKLAEAQCSVCHGKDFKTPLDPSYPRLAGQYDDYLAKALNDYRTGGRKNPVMGGMARGLSRADVENVAAYLSTLPGPLTQPRLPELHEAAR